MQNRGEGFVEGLREVRELEGLDVQADWKSSRRPDHFLRETAGE